jgi:hypothetical protein
MIRRLLGNPSNAALIRAAALCLFLFSTATLSAGEAKAALLAGKMIDGTIVSFDVYAGTIKEGESRAMVVRCDSDKPATVLAFAWDEEGQRLHEGWAPSLETLDGSSAVSLPPGDPLWIATSESAEFAIYVAVIANDDPAVSQLQALVAAMAKEGVPEQARVLQANKLKEIYDAWLAGKDRSEIKGRHERASAAISYRGVGSKADPEKTPWRAKALETAYEGSSPGLLIFPVGEKGEE